MSARNTILLASVVAGQWTFSWPYGADNTCICKRSGVSFVAFETEAECLQAFEDSAAELCQYQKSTVTEDQCDAAVAITQGLYNSACTGKCTKAVAGLIDLTEYFEDCDFEFVTEFEETVALGHSGCFNNLVYGWADFDPTNSNQVQPLRIFEDVPTAARCQELCQDVPQCVHFTWKAFADNTASYQNEPHTCVLHSSEYMEAVLNTPLSALETKYCDYPRVEECAEIMFPRDSYNVFEDLSCLLCDCVPKCAWESPYHVSGPAFCDDSREDLCAYERPSWSTTPQPPCETEECECPTETCEAPHTQTSSSAASVISLYTPGLTQPPALGETPATGETAPTPAPGASTSQGQDTAPASTPAASITPVGTPEAVATSTMEEGTPEENWTGSSTLPVGGSTIPGTTTQEFSEEGTPGFTVTRTSETSTSPEALVTTTVVTSTTTGIELDTTEAETSSAETVTTIELESSVPAESTVKTISPLPTTAYLTRSLLPPTTPCPDCPVFVESDCDDCESEMELDCMPNC